jgi:hypothetical protein
MAGPRRADTTTREIPVTACRRASSNRGAIDVQLEPADHGRLDEAFPPPLGPQPLEGL